MTDLQDVTLAEALLLLIVNYVGVSLTGLAWRVSDVDVAEANAWEPPADGSHERDRLRHNRLIYTRDARHGEVRRLQAHLLIAVVGVFWTLSPQPVNPSVVWWAVVIRAVVILLSLLLIDKTIHHLVARWRFNRTRSSDSLLANCWPALRLAWRDARPKPRGGNHAETP